MESFPKEPKIIDGIVKGSPVATAMEDMDKIPTLMSEIVGLSKSKKLLQTALNVARESLEPTTTSMMELQSTYTDTLNKYMAKKREMEQIINTLEQNGHGFIVQGSREQLSLLD